MPFAEVNGQRLRFDDSGGDGPPVILSHGFLMDREMFAPQVEALSPEFRVITWDERGFGETEFDGQPAGPQVPSLDGDQLCGARSDGVQNSGHCCIKANGVLAMQRSGKSRPSSTLENRE